MSFENVMIFSVFYSMVVNSGLSPSSARMEFNEGPKTTPEPPRGSPLRLASGSLRASLGGSLRGPFIEFHFPDDVIVRLFAGAADLEKEKCDDLRQDIHVNSFVPKRACESSLNSITRHEIPLPLSSLTLL